MAAKVEMDCGITVVFLQTGDPSNNGTSATRGRCAALYLLPLSAFRKPSSEDDDGDSGPGAVSTKLPVVKAAPLCTGMTTDSLSSTIRVTEWAVNVLSTVSDGGSAATGTSSSSSIVVSAEALDTTRKCAEAVLVFALRLLASNLQDANLFPKKPKAAVEDEDGMLLALLLPASCLCLCSYECSRSFLSGRNALLLASKRPHCVARILCLVSRQCC